MIDIVPTILEATGVKEPKVVDGIQQRPIDGVSMMYTFDAKNANALSTHKTQYFEMFGDHAIYHDGWIASTKVMRPPWVTAGGVGVDATSILNSSYNFRAEVEVPEGGGEGMLVTQGGRFAGYGFYLLKGKPVFTWNLVDLKRVKWEGPEALSPGRHVIEFDFRYDGLGMATLAFNGKIEKITLTIDRPQLTPEDIKKLETAQRNNKVSE